MQTLAQRFTCRFFRRGLARLERARFYRGSKSFEEALYDECGQASGEAYCYHSYKFPDGSSVILGEKSWGFTGAKE